VDVGTVEEILGDVVGGHFVCGLRGVVCRGKLWIVVLFRAEVSKLSVVTTVRLSDLLEVLIQLQCLDGTG
jgi:hypothetical protein